MITSEVIIIDIIFSVMICGFLKELSTRKHIKHGTLEKCYDLCNVLQIMLGL